MILHNSPLRVNRRAESLSDRVARCIEGTKPWGIILKSVDVLPALKDGASTAVFPSPIEGSGSTWVGLVAWASSPARPTPIHPRRERRGLPALFGDGSTRLRASLSARADQAEASHPRRRHGCPYPDQFTAPDSGQAGR